MADRYFRFRARPSSINPASDSEAVDDCSCYDGDQSDCSSSIMSAGPTASNGHQLTTAGFEPIVPQETHVELERIEARLRALEKEEESRIASRTNVLLARRDHDTQLAQKRKREDDQFQVITERAEAEEEVSTTPVFALHSLFLCLSSQLS
jgi:hypothetical protein